jgi:hypothetical protein
LPPPESSAFGSKSKRIPILEFPDPIFPGFLPEFQLHSTTHYVQLYNHKFEFINNLCGDPFDSVFVGYTDILQTNQLAAKPVSAPVN